MRKLILPFFLLLLLTSCASYTIAEAREIITFPESGTTETRIRVISEEKADKERERLERLEKEKVNEYPFDLSSLRLPFYYNSVKNSETVLKSENTTFSAVLIPLGEEDLTEEQLHSVVSFLEDYPFTFAALTGKLSNQTAVASGLKKDAVTTEGGTIIFDNAVLEQMNEEYTVFALTEEKSVTVYSKDFHPADPGAETDEEALMIVDNLEKKYAEELVEKVSSAGTEARILFLSSIAPSSLDWTDWTEYSYRTDRSFLISDMLLSLRWIDAFAQSRHSEETETGVTRTIGKYSERLDFIYSKGMITLSSLAVPVENLPYSATVAYFLIP